MINGADYCKWPTPNLPARAARRCQALSVRSSIPAPARPCACSNANVENITGASEAASIGVSREQRSRRTIDVPVCGATPDPPSGARTIHPGRPIAGRAFGDGPVLVGNAAPVGSLFHEAIRPAAPCRSGSEDAPAIHVQGKGQDHPWRCRGADRRRLDRGDRDRGDVRQIVSNLKRNSASVAVSARRATHFGLPEIMRIVQPLAQKYLSFRKAEVMI
jgi:hypothetical protein